MDDGAGRGRLWGPWSEGLLRRQEEVGGASEMINAKLEGEVKQGLIILIGLSSNPQLLITTTANQL